VVIRGHEHVRLLFADALAAAAVMKAADILPPGWRGVFAPAGRVGIGMDLGTTNKAKSNPTAIAVCQEVGLDVFTRLLIRYKVDATKLDVHELLLRLIVEGLHAVDLRVVRVCVDATSERYGAAELARRLRGLVPVALIVASEGTEYRGQKMKFKEYQTNLYLHQIDDGRLALPDEQWVEDDARQVKTERGLFYADVDEEGNHADTFDATKQALHALRMHGGGGAAEVTGAGAGGFAQGGRAAGAWKMRLPEDTRTALPI
jgi:hypothetical protein